MDITNHAYRAFYNIRGEIGRPHADEKSIDAELEREYIRKHFYDNIGTIFANFSLAFFGLDLFLAFFLPGAHYAGAVGSILWLNIFVMCKYIVRYKGTEQEIYGKELFDIAFIIVLSVHEIFQASMATEEGRTAHVSMVVLAVYAIGWMVLRIAFPKYKSSHIVCVMVPLLAFTYPRFGIFSPRCEALAFFIAMGSGELIGEAFDEMRWRHFLSMHEKELDIEKKSKELRKESRKKEMVMEALSSFEQARWKA